MQLAWAPDAKQNAIRIAALIVLVVAIVVLGVKFADEFVRRRSTGAVPSDEALVTAKLLRAANARVYGRSDCGFTRKQMQRFGPHASVVDYTECTAEDPTCRSIAGFPTWIIGGEMVLGDRTLVDLRARAERVLRGDGPGAGPDAGPPPAMHRAAQPAPATDGDYEGVVVGGGLHPVL